MNRLVWFITMALLLPAAADAQPAVPTPTSFAIDAGEKVIVTRASTHDTIRGRVVLVGQEGLVLDDATQRGSHASGGFYLFRITPAHACLREQLPAFSNQSDKVVPDRVDCWHDIGATRPLQLGPMSAVSVDEVSAARAASRTCRAWQPRVSA